MALISLTLDACPGALLENLSTGQSVYFQPGDDAQAFRDTYSDYCRVMDFDDAAEAMWSLYGHLAAEAA